MTTSSAARLFVAARPDERWAAWVADHRVLEFHLERRGQESRVGDIHLGRITSVDKRLNASFVDIDGAQSAFLPLHETAGPVVEGATMIVQVERDSRDGKRPRLTARPALLGGRLILTPHRREIAIAERIVGAGERHRLKDIVKAIAGPGEGWTVRTAAGQAEATILREEAVRLRTIWHDIAARAAASQSPTLLHREPAIDCRLMRDHGAQFAEVVYDDRAAAEIARRWCMSMQLEVGSRISYRRCGDWVPSPAEVHEQVEDALNARVGLPSGGNVLFEPGATLTAIDVNSGSAGGFGGDGSVERVILQANLEAADAIARELRLRNIGGIIVIDFIDLKDTAARRHVVGRLRAAVSSDSAPCWVGTMSRLGLVEMTRRRRGPTLTELMTTTCDRCEGTGRLRRAASAADEARDG